MAFLAVIDKFYKFGNAPSVTSTRDSPIALHSTANSTRAFVCKLGIHNSQINPSDYVTPDFFSTTRHDRLLSFITHLHLYPNYASGCSAPNIAIPVCFPVPDWTPVGTPHLGPQSHDGCRCRFLSPAHHVLRLGQLPVCAQDLVGLGGKGAAV